MSLPTGTRLGPYEIVSPIGAGGMGEVFLAKDTRLNRDVAIKVLPASFALDAERIARFTREAQVLASLNHPNIAHIHGLEEQDGVRALVMEFVEGEDLSQQIARGPMAAADAIEIARQLIDALEAAHEAGVVHRDLKPANIKVRPDGTVKVLDFGLAKIALGDGPAAATGAMNSPTMTSPATQLGMILGTAAYMAPEQAKGRAVDKRADIWAFGCILHEMLTGRRLFAGEDVSETLAAVLRADVDLNALPPATPAGVRRLVGRCLERDPKKRLRDIGDARFDLHDVDAHPAAAPGAAPAVSRANVSRGMFLAGMIIALTAGAVGGVWWHARYAAPPVELTGVALGGPATSLYPMISPDGQLLAFQAMVNGQTQVAVMKPGTGNWTVLTSDRTKGLVDNVAWSADGSKIYFDRRTDVFNGVYTVPALGGDPRLVIENAGSPLPLKDGSLIVMRLNAERRHQLFRLWPGAGRVDALPVDVTALSGSYGKVRALDDHRIVALGTPIPSDGRPFGLYAITLDTGGIAAVIPGLDPDRVRSIAVRPRDGALILAVGDGSTYRVIEYQAGGRGVSRTLLSMTARPWVDVGPDDALYMSISDRPGAVLRFGTAGGAVESLAANFSMLEGAKALDDGRTLVTFRGAMRRVMVAAPGKESVAFVETDEETHGPIASLGKDRVALFIGGGQSPDIAIVTTATGRVEKRLKAPAGIECLDASPDGTRLYFAASGTISVMPVDGGAPQVVLKGNSFAVDPESGDLIVKLHDQGRMSLARRPAAGGELTPMAIKGALALIDEPLMAGSIRNGQLLAPVSTKDSWFWFAAVLDLKTGQLTRLPFNQETDVHFLSWTQDGRVLATVVGVRASLWKYSQAAAK